jgi:heme A synthase
MTNSLKIFNNVAKVNLFAIFVMVLLGAYVKNSGSSLACPDWPLCHGQVFPNMVGGVAIEHSHRLLGTLLGLLTLTLGILAFQNRKEYPKLWKCSLTAVFLVLLQGSLGGITVLNQISPLVSAIHWIISQFYLATILWLLLMSQNNLRGVIPFKQVPEKISKNISLAIGFLLVQFFLGTFIRHSGAAGACGLGWGNSLLCLDDVSGTSVLWPSNLMAKLNMLHRIWGVVTFAIIIWATIPFLKWARKNNIKVVRLFVIFTHIAVTFQVLFGIKVIGTGLANYSVLLHVLFAMLIWTFLIVLKFKSTEMKTR